MAKKLILTIQNYNDPDSFVEIRQTIHYQTIADLTFEQKQDLIMTTIQKMEDHEEKFGI